MTYTFKNTEINNEKASTFETKSLLYLIGKRKDSKEIDILAFDCFNDVSGINKKYDKIWDIQSKNEKTLSPKKIGTYLFTLFDNSISSFSFSEFILFTTILKDDYKIDNSKNIYLLNNIEPKTLKRIEAGLKEEIKRVKGDKVDLSKEISSFLSKVLIVEDVEPESEYIKAITRFKDSKIKPDEFYVSVFKDLRDIQTAKKNTYIENEVITEIREVLKFNRHLSKKNIDTLIINRIIGCEIFTFKSIPISFITYVSGLDQEDITDLILECNSNLSRAFFNKNSNKEFWSVCEEIINIITLDNSKSVDTVHSDLLKLTKIRSSNLDTMTLKFLVSIIKDGLK